MLCSCHTRLSDRSVRRAPKRFAAEIAVIAISRERESSRTRLVEAAEQLMREDGYAAVTSRRVAGKAGLKPQLVHYYFTTMDDLFLAVLHRGIEQNGEILARVLASARPLQALWEFASDPQTAVMSAEFAALANHRKSIRAEIARYGRQLRDAQISTIARILKANRVRRDVCPPAALAIIMDLVARGLVSEVALGMSKGHTETIALVQRYLRKLGGIGVRRRMVEGRST
jgi:TetR/AcrR family transcriptional regulator